MTQDKFLKGKKVAILATDGFEEVELKAPMEELKAAGAEVSIVSEKARIRSWHDRDWHEDFNVDVLLENANPENYVHAASSRGCHQSGPAATEPGRRRFRQEL